MPRGLILLLLLLLVGGYFLFFSGKGTTYVIPQISAEGKVVKGEDGYTVVLDGKLVLPANGDYNVESLVATLLVNGLPADKKDFGSHGIKGPDEFPFTFTSSFSPTATKVAVQIDANVSHGKDVYVLSSVIPVALPDKSTLVKQPSISVSLSDIALLGSTKSATVIIALHNTNEQSITLKGLKLSFGSESFDLASKETLGAGKTVRYEQSISVPADAVSVKLAVSGTYSASGVEGSINESFDLNVPKLSEQPLRFEVSASASSLSESGYELNVYGKIYNDNKFNVGIDSLTLRVVDTRADSNVIQEVALLESKDVAPSSSLSFSKTVLVDNDFADAVAELVVKQGDKQRIVYSFPLGLFDPSDFIEAPEIRVEYVYDANTGCSFYPVVTNGNDFNVDVDLSLKVSNGATTTEKDYGSFTLEKDTSKSFSSDPAGPLPGELNVSISGKYGIEELGIWLPISLAFEYNCST